MIILYQFPSTWGLPSTSPFCLKIETYLRMMEIPYENKFVMNPSKSPRGKFPYIKVAGKDISDSALIIKFLKEKFGDSFDRNLTKDQKAFACLLEETFSESFYWILLYARWQNPKAWSFVKESFFAKLPGIMKKFVPNTVRKKMVKLLYLQGAGRFNYEEILYKGFKIIDSLATILGEKKYFLGEEIASIDATAFAFLANTVWVPYQDDLKMHLQKYPNLLVYCDKMWNSFYPEIPKPFALF